MSWNVCAVKSARHLLSKITEELLQLMKTAAKFRHFSPVEVLQTFAGLLQAINVGADRFLFPIR